MFNFNWLIAMGATPAVIIVFVMGVLFAAYVISRDVQQRDTTRLQWAELKELRQKYHQVDKLTYGIGIAIQRKTNIKLFKQSADGDGDNALNRDVG